MPKLIDLTGKTFGRLTVICRDNSKLDKRSAYWLCKCECGNIVSVDRGSLQSGSTKSCGCYRKEISSMSNHNKYDLSGEYGIGYTTNTNKPFYFDLEDYDKIKNYCWYENENGYIITQKKRKTIRLHRLIMDLNSEDKIQVDHIYHKPYDNRKSQLRLVTNQQNSMNKQVKGVYWNKEKSKWVANLTYNGKKYFSYFKTYEEALEQRKKYEQQYYKEYAYKEKG